MKREEIYKIIDGEREYQEIRWVNEPIHSPTEYLVFIEEYIKIGKTLATFEDDAVMKPKIMDVMRKIISLGVACAESHGLPERSPKNDTFTTGQPGGE